MQHTELTKRGVKKRNNNRTIIVLIKILLEVIKCFILQETLKFKSRAFYCTNEYHKFDPYWHQ